MQKLYLVAITQRAGKPVCGRHAAQHDDFAAETAAMEAEAAFEDDLFALVEATVWADPWAPAFAEIDEIWYSGVAS